MTKKKEYLEIVLSKNQLHLYGYSAYFNLFVKLYEKKKIPNCILLSGLKGSGKSTFVYHLTNYLLSKDEEKKYSINNFTINRNNLSYRYICANTHPNFYLVDNNILEKDIHYLKHNLTLFLAVDKIEENK